MACEATPANPPGVVMSLKQGLLLTKEATPTTVSRLSITAMRGPKDEIGIKQAIFSNDQIRLAKVILGKVRLG